MERNMTVNDLKAYGANTQEGLNRCMKNEGFYLRLVKMIPGDPNFQKLYQALDAGDMDAAFAAAHSLKGSTGNLSLTPINAPVVELTELLRTKAPGDYTALTEKIRKARDELARICES